MCVSSFVPLPRLGLLCRAVFCAGCVRLSFESAGSGEGHLMAAKIAIVSMASAWKVCVTPSTLGVTLKLFTFFCVRV